MEKIPQNSEREQKVLSATEAARYFIKQRFDLDLTPLELAGLRELTRKNVDHDSDANSFNRTAGFPEVITQFMAEYYDLETRLLYQMLGKKKDGSVDYSKLRSYLKKIQDERHLL